MHTKNWSQARPEGAEQLPQDTTHDHATQASQERKERSINEKQGEDKKASSPPTKREVNQHANRAQTAGPQAKASYTGNTHEEHATDYRKTHLRASDAYNGHRKHTRRVGRKIRAKHSSSPTRKEGVHRQRKKSSEGTICPTRQAPYRSGDRGHS